MRVCHGGWVALVLAGCWGAPDAELQAWMQAQRAAVHSHGTPLAAPKTFQPHSYLGASAADPFDMEKLQAVWRHGAASSATSTLRISPEYSRSKQALEAFPLDTMVMVGSLEQQGQKTALLRVDKLLYPVRAGQYLGQNHGLVLRVSENRIQLRELIQDAAGEWVEKMSTLDLQEGPP